MAAESSPEAGDRVEGEAAGEELDVDCVLWGLLAAWGGEDLC